MNTVTFKEAGHRYTRIFAPVMIFYIIFCFAGPALLSVMDNPPKLAYIVVAIFNGAPIAIVFWLMARYLREVDEYIRKIQIDGILAGGGFTMSAATIWAFLEIYDVVPRLPAMMMVAPIFFASYGLASAYKRLRRK